MSNPLLTAWDTPFGIPPFSKINPSHFFSAFADTMAQQNDTIASICDSADTPTFANTIETLEESGAMLRRVNGVFENLALADTNDKLKAIELDIGPRLAAHEGAIWTNRALYARVQALKSASTDLGEVEKYLLDELLTRFHRAGADLDKEQRAEVLRLDEELASLYTRFEQNVRDDANSFELALETQAELSGLPDFVLDTARAEAENRGHSGQYVFTISRSSITPFLQYSSRRDLREKIYQAYIRCGDNDNHCNNRAVILDIVSRRRRRAQLLGFDSHAHFMLDDRMAQSPDAVRQLLDRLWGPALARLKNEQDDLTSLAGGDIDTLEPWDWWYYTEKLRGQRFDLDAAEVKAYFPLERVRDGAFAVAEKLYGLSFTALQDVPTYHKDIETFEVKDANGEHLGVFMTDYFGRASKAAGAWMSEFRGASKLGSNTRPLVINCCNFNKSSPALLDMDEVRTLFHELGHGLHSLLTQARYPSLAGTNVKQDFVELPSQIMEHWAREPEVLRHYAQHHITNEPIPQRLIEKLHAAEAFNQGFATTEYLAACYLDLAWHELREDPSANVEVFEDNALSAIDLCGPIHPRYRSTYFQHIFTGDSYSAGYYAYIWAEVLDADGYDVFRENGIFDRETATAFRRHVLEPGGTANPMQLYVKFRGREPQEAPLLRNRGLVTG